MTKVYLFLFAALFTAGVYAQAPSGYYSSANGLTGDALKAELNNIISGHTEYSYSDLWNLLQETDKDPNNPNNVIGIYSRFSMNAAAAYDNGNGWNREHVWAKSRGDFGTANGPGTDLHHLRVEDVSTNSARSNRAFDDGGTQYVDASGTYSGATPAKSSSTNYTWYPGDEVKGDVARMLFYMATRYEGENGEPDLELTEDVLPNTDKQPLHGVLSSLLAWHNADPVSAEEINRNNIVYGYQNNRNPYIDHPEYVAEIWGGPTGGGSGTGGTTCADTEVTFTLVFDNYPSETSWTLTQGATTIASGSGYSTANATITETYCLADGDYTFTINDQYGDGICCTYGNGSYDFSTGSTSLISGGQFGSTESQTFTIGTTGGGSGNGGSTGTVIISEYVEGSSNNKAIEIANLGSSSVDLSNYSLKKQTNGAGAWSTALSLSGTLAAQDVYVIVYSSAGSTLQAKADLLSSSAVMSFNGNDPIGLFENDVLTDVVGNFDGGSANFAQNVTLQRLASVGSGSTTYSTSEWNTSTQDDFSNLGMLTGGTSGGGSGSGSTLPTGYCTSKGNNSSYEYISTFSFGSINNSSGNDGGYGDYTSLSTSVSPGSSYSFSLTPAFPSGAYNEYLEIWIDYNRDGDFNDSGESAYSTGPFQSTVSGSITIPSSAGSGVTLMRVSMKYNSSSTSCESFSYGEVEDYVIDLGGSGARLAAESTPAVEGPSPTSLYPNPAAELVNINLDVKLDGDYTVRMVDLNGKVMINQSIKASNAKLESSVDISTFSQGIYFIHISGNGLAYKNKLIVK